MKARHRAKFPEVDSAKCACKKHKRCGCFSDAFIQGATSAAFSSARMLHSMLKGLERSQDTTAETFMSGRMESAISTTRSVAVVENVKTWLN